MCHQAALLVIDAAVKHIAAFDGAFKPLFKQLFGAAFQVVFAPHSIAFGKLALHRVKLFWAERGGHAERCRLGVIGHGQCFLPHVSKHLAGLRGREVLRHFLLQSLQQFNVGRELRLPMPSLELAQVRLDLHALRVGEVHVPIQVQIGQGRGLVVGNFYRTAGLQRQRYSQQADNSDQTPQT